MYFMAVYTRVVPGTPQIHDRKIKTDFYSTQITVPVHRVQVRLYRCVRVYVYYFYKLQLLPVVHTCVYAITGFNQDYMK